MLKFLECKIIFLCDVHSEGGGAGRGVHTLIIISRKLIPLALLGGNAGLVLQLFHRHNPFLTAPDVGLYPRLSAPVAGE